MRSGEPVIGYVENAMRDSFDVIVALKGTILKEMKWKGVPMAMRIRQNASIALQTVTVATLFRAWKGVVTQAWYAIQTIDELCVATL